MDTYGYIARISASSARRQRQAIAAYHDGALADGITWIEDHRPDRQSWEDRQLGLLLRKTAGAGDLVVFADVASMARSLPEALEIIAAAIKRGVSVCIAREDIMLDADVAPTLRLDTLAIAAALARVCAIKPDGRPRRRAGESKLDRHEKRIREMLEGGVSRTAIAKAVGCSRSVLYEWMEARGYHARHAAEPEKISAFM